MLLAACGQGSGASLESAPSARGQALGLGAAHARPPVSELPADDYTLFEADPVRPVAVLAHGGLIAVANTFDDFVELVRAEPDGTLSPCGGTRVGLRPVALALVDGSGRDSALRGGGGQGASELWVVNHLSDSISIVEIDAPACAASLVDTLHVGDEPRDIVVATAHDGRQSAFITTAHRGQSHPVEGARSGADLVTPAGEKQNPGLADVFVFDTDRRELRGVVNLFSDVPRALAVGDGVVYAAGFLTGNRTTSVMAERVLTRGLTTLEPLLLQRAGAFVEQDGELVLAEGVAGRAAMQGGMPAVAGRGRCVPDPRDDRADRFFAQVCVQTDEQQHVERVLIESPGVVHDGCQCTSGDGSLQPTTSVIVRFHDSEAECGAAFATFPDGSQGCWLDAVPGGVVTPAAHGAAQPVPMSWNGEVRFGLPDRDVFAIDVASLAVERSVSHVGTVIYGLAVQPGSERLFAANTEAQNLTRFEGAGTAASTTVQGHLHESRLSIIDGAEVTAVHLNDHIDYGRCCQRDPVENARSLALPTSLAFSPDGRQLYFTALGSDRVALMDASRVGADFHNASAREHGWLRDVKLGSSDDEPTGPVGLALDAEHHTLYVKTHFTNELVAIDAEAAEITGRVSLTTPEPAAVQRGRPILYDATRTSAHGDSACASCHVFGNFDGLAWDLGDPDIPTAKNPGPLAQGAAIFGLSGLVRDPFSTQIIGRDIVEDFRSNKGPMATQTLRGLANHGAQHWRGDRTRRFQDIPGAQPDTGSLDENSSFNEFDAAIVALNGNDAPLPAEQFQEFTDFALQLTLPPNPVRALDNQLSPEQSRARATFFGCSSMSDADFAERECTALDGEHVDVDAETRACACSKHPLLPMLRDLPKVSAFLGGLQPLLGDPARRAASVQAATAGADLPADRATELAQIGGALDAAFVALSAVDLSLDGDALLAQHASDAVRDLGAALAALDGVSRVLHLDLKRRLYDALSSPATGEPGAPLPTPSALASGFDLSEEVGRVNAAVLADRAAAGTGAYRDLLMGCEVAQTYACRLRVVDTVTTCNGCHTLDPNGNAEFGVYRPGFFGTSGMYSFESLSQTFKVPHLRNGYTKAGMFGVSSNIFLTPNSLLGDRLGGFPSVEGVFMGEQVRGFGFLHDGSVDTMHHFFGSAAFAARPPGAVSRRDPGNPSAFQGVLPALDSRAACVAEFRAISDARFAQMPAGLELCRSTSPLPDVCFLDPTAPACTRVLAALAIERGDPGFAATFTSSTRPGCFRMGSTLQGGAASGSCFPEGLRDRTDMEAFMLAFDTNLEPMVGQQLSLPAGSSGASPLLRSLLTVAARGGCDVAARQAASGYLMTEPDPSSPDQSQLLDADGQRHSLAELRRCADPLTLTCYPPHPSQAEARRSAFSR